MHKHYFLISAAIPEPGVQAGPEGFPVGLLLCLGAFLGAAARHDRLHQLDELAAQLVLPPAVLHLQQSKPFSVTRPEDPGKAEEPAVEHLQVYVLTQALVFISPTIIPDNT